MLKALELVGFKSFADKTRLEFPRGITVVVGPNGSGKSNVVDAIKWVLGEQSVKSLRGKEMADVIFNGAAGRKPLHSAEVSLIFDNTQRLLAVDTAEVQITRRVYRSGEGEYLVNRQPCRLRDIRDLLAGTGMATEAYSVIEQGKVDVLLQSSPRERRLIFEEAAGISRFKAKKLEAQRRLERVDQNLLRLSDIVEEVESRLASVRQQATKAQRYKENADRLQLLRTELGLIDWRRLTAEITAVESDVASMRQELDAATAEAEALLGQAARLEQEIAEIESQLAAGNLRGAENRERIAANESAIEHQRRRYQDLEEETARYRRQLTAITARADDLEAQSAAIEQSLVETSRQQRELSARLANEERELAQLTSELESLRADHEQLRANHLEKLRIASTLSNRISAIEAQHEAAQAAQQRGERRLAEVSAVRDTVAGEHAELAPRLDSLTTSTTRQRSETKELDARVSASRSEQTQLQQEVAALRERQSRASERHAVLEELERRQEGLTSGVKEVLQRARSASPGPWSAVRGLVADLLQVHIERAPLIESALGEVAQQIVITGGDELLAYLQSDEAKFRGRVTFLRLDAPAIASAELVDFDEEPGVLGRADRFVETAPEYAVLARRLLGRTWLVDTLARGLTLAGAAGRGVNFVTAAGEMVSADGSISVGARGSATGLISRRSELRSLRELIADLTAQVSAKQAALAAVERQLSIDTEELKRRAAALAVAERELGEIRLRALAAEQRLTALEGEGRALAAEVAASAANTERSGAALATARSELAATEAEIAELDERSQRSATLTLELEQARQRTSRETSATRIDVARVEQQLENLRRQLAQLARDRQERGRSLADNRAQLDLALGRAAETERNILAAESELALLYLGKESLAGETIAAMASRDAARERRGAVLQSEQRLQNKARKSETKLHARELAAGEARHSRSTIEERLREDYGIELATSEDPTPKAPELSRGAMEHEIADLRARLNSIGAVNLDALAELEQLDARYSSLAAQHQDLATAKASLDEIIERINADSRRLFADTLELVRGHFQSLFRKLFGGGQADILLDEGVDILESGVEIVARPPGKEPRSISLLSGGEKTLTCVALLMSIFRSRPSPFCVLDEVDAALDEANIERFIGVLQEFLTDTQFIVVTHSKKTMTAAGVIYGITMQESGISKRVSVRFEDVSEDGQIIVNRDASADAATAEDGETQAA